MFTEDELNLLEQLGENGTTIKSCSSYFSMTRKKFLEKYNSSEEGQMAFEMGQSKLESKVLAILDKNINDGKDYRYFQYKADNIVGLKIDPKAKDEKIDNKPKINRDNDKLINPHLLFDDDEE